MNLEHLKRGKEIEGRLRTYDMALRAVVNSPGGLNLREIFEDFPCLKSGKLYRKYVKKVREKLIWDIKNKIVMLEDEFRGL